ncbi:hypothetical protein [Streptomyces sp. NPDC089799]|uniref:hypothetical protein n=1 Tax=Streptomyces sp. NPDC089799 TaxID=3155066 RepID=UPI0034481423
MGIESEHLVREYLSRVGDLAQSAELPSPDRMRLVARLRDEIERHRARYEPETPATVRHILERMGTPEEVLATHAGAPAPAPAPGRGSAAQTGAVPEQRGSAAAAAPASAPVAPAVPPARTAGAPPHLAGLDELGPSGDAEPDWWRMGPSLHRDGPQVEGFVGGIEYPSRRGPDPDRDPTDGDPETAAPDREAGTAGAAVAPGARGLVRALLKRGAGAAGAAPARPVDKTAPSGDPKPKPHGFLLLAAAVLVAGVVIGHWMLLALGWLCAYGSRVLGPTERKTVVFGLPGAVVAGAMVWLWGRADGRWGEALAAGEAGPAFQSLLPWIVRGAAIASALYLIWRSRRR